MSTPFLESVPFPFVVVSVVEVVVLVVDVVPESGFDVRMLVVGGEVKQLWRGPTSLGFMSLLVSVGVSLSSLIPAA